MATIKKLTSDEIERLQELSYSLLLAAEQSDMTAIEQARGELRIWFDTNKTQEE